ncbi:MAG: MBL fold metallo-hydrolase, partial [Sphingomonadales bacterium]|nr:MBL fold metallo-hydrolase [Sphingomonadales bacterium]
RRQRERQILRLLEPAPAAITTLVPQMYRGVDERLWTAAGQSVLAHLIDLEQRAMVRREGDLWAILA